MALEAMAFNVASTHRSEWVRWQETPIEEDYLLLMGVARRLQAINRHSKIAQRCIGYATTYADLQRLPGIVTRADLIAALSQGSIPVDYLERRLRIGKGFVRIVELITLDDAYPSLQEYTAPALQQPHPMEQLEAAIAAELGSRSESELTS